MADQIELCWPAIKLKGDERRHDHAAVHSISPDAGAGHQGQQGGVVAEELALALRTREVRAFHRSKGTINIEMPRAKPGEVEAGGAAGPSGRAARCSRRCWA
ncbi:MAG: hypothetical protein R2838_03295 [Caldilineaceae bacterium]